MLYSMSDNRQVNVPVEVGGCGTPHEIIIGEKGKYIDCAAGCEAWLTKVPSLGWSNHPGGVAMTPDEIGASERAEKAAKAAGVAHLNSLQAGQQLGGVPQALLDQLAAMQQQMATLMAANATLAAQVAAPGGALTSDAAVPDAPPAPEPVAPETPDAAPEQPKRASRPRKATAAAAA